MGKIHDKTKNNFKKGSVEMLMLHILQEADCYGYEIAQNIKERSGGRITVLEGSMYPILYRLEEAGFISPSDGSKSRSVYITMDEYDKLYGEG